ncbi:hypothetical protein DM01DRAFT_329586 [Hesseltinella vesiculosa]|uniref:F-box domain-containing protein n=1 Tax=Hesseltinella vesiculosa TaxID=101127 RepID=A0A1X2GKF5_9FUNG|nr:hypothetical protein DM01DRAFT_329586 [Hesseltinella vesiculosa]
MHINDFPSEILLHVLRFVPQQSLTNSAKVCSVWRTCVRSVLFQHVALFSFDQLTLFIKGLTLDLHLGHSVRSLTIHCPVNGCFIDKWAELPLLCPRVQNVAVVSLPNHIRGYHRDDENSRVCHKLAQAWATCNQHDHFFAGDTAATAQGLVQPARHVSYHGSHHDSPFQIQHVLQRWPANATSSFLSLPQSLDLRNVTLQLEQVSLILRHMARLEKLTLANVHLQHSPMTSQPMQTNVATFRFQGSIDSHDPTALFHCLRHLFPKLKLLDLNLEPAPHCIQLAVAMVLAAWR